VPVFTRKQADWEVAATQVMEKLCKHPYIDQSKMVLGSVGSVIADFFHPVLEIFPQLAEEYLSKVSSPMDLGTLRDDLKNGVLLDADDFYEKVVLVFTNVAKYNEGGASDFSKAMAAKGLHLARYAKWLCLEHLPIKSEERHAERPEALGDLRTGVLAKERQERELILKGTFIGGSTSSTGLTLCRRILKNIKATKGKEEVRTFRWFSFSLKRSRDQNTHTHAHTHTHTHTHRRQR